MTHLLNVSRRHIDLRHWTVWGHHGNLSRTWGGNIMSKFIKSEFKQFSFATTF